MALYYSIVASLLVVEMGFFTLLSLPYPRSIRRRVLYTASAPFRNPQFQTAIKCVLGFVAVLFVDSVNRVYAVTAELHGTSLSGPVASQAALPMLTKRSEIQARRFYAQRNMYLCGSTLFLTLILTRTYALVVELITVKDNLDAASQNTLSSSKAQQLKDQVAKSDEEIDVLKAKAAALSKDYELVSKRK